MIIHNGDHMQYEADNVNTPPKKRADWPLPSFSCEDWAEAFCKKHPQMSMDEMRAWFACALMRGHDEGIARQNVKEQP